MPRFAHRLFPCAAWMLTAVLALSPDRPALALTPSERVTSLARAASDPGLAEWQREFYRERLAEALACPASTRDELTSPLAAVADAPIWSVLADTPRRQGHTLVVDDDTGRLIAFGGRNGANVFNTVFVIEPGGAREWHALAVTGPAPPARLAHTAVLDRANRRMLVYGGTDADGSYLADLWSLNLDGPPAWTELAPAGAAPQARANHFAVADTAHARMLVYGGADGGFNPLTDLWALALDASPAWAPLEPANAFPAGFTPQAMLLDEGRHRLVFPGVQTVNYSTNWVLAALSLDVPAPNWVVVTTPYQNSPSPYSSSVVLFTIDAAGDRLVGVYSEYYTYTYVLPLGGSPTQWTQVAGTGAMPTQRYGRANAQDAAHRRWFFTGGGASSGSSSTRTVSDLASLDLSGLAAWTAVAGDPPARSGHSLAHDPARGIVHLFGGSCDSTGTGYGSTLTNTLWALSSGAASPAWTPENSGGGPLLPRHNAALAVDPARDRLMLFGGANGNQTTNEVWQRPLAGGTAWSRVAIGGTLPRQRSNAAMVYDPDGDRLLVFGGYDNGAGTNGFLPDLWALSLGGTPAWTRLLPAGPAPAGRADAFLAFDPVRHCAYLFCGRYSSYSSGDPLRANEVWRLTFSPALSWERLAAGDDVPYSVTDVTGAGFYDAAQGALVRAAYFYDYGTYPADAKTKVTVFHPGADTSWSELAFTGSRPPASVDARGVFDPQARRLVWFGGFELGADGTWALSFGAPPLDVPPTVAEAARALRLAPNPARGACTARFALARPGRVTLELLDLSGRRVRGPVSAELPAGPAEMRLGDLSALPAGVYFARVSGALERRARVAVVH